MTNEQKADNESMTALDKVFPQQAPARPTAPPPGLGSNSTRPTAPPIQPRGKPDPYRELRRILSDAFDQASIGKGHERHAYSPVSGPNLPWDKQPILANARQVGPGGPAQQVMKKAGESVTLAGNKDFTKAKAEALGIIVYAAALFKLYEEMDTAYHADD